MNVGRLDKLELMRTAFTAEEGCLPHQGTTRVAIFFSVDLNLFVAATRVTVGDENTAKFWESPWLDGLRPKDIAPKIFELSKKKTCLVR